MKSYLCIESEKEAFEASAGFQDKKERAAVYFVLKAESWKQASEQAKEMGAKTVRVLTKKEAKSKSKDGSYDIKL